MQNKALEKDRIMLTAKTKRILSENEETKTRITSLNASETIEKLARERLNYIKKGENAFKVCR